MFYVDQSCDLDSLGCKYLASILYDVEVGDYDMFLCESPRGGYYLQIRFTEACNETGVVCEQQCRKWLLEKCMSTTEVVRTAYKAYEAAVIHEMQEKFKFRGEAIFNPHKDVCNLLDKTPV